MVAIKTLPPVRSGLALKHRDLQVYRKVPPSTPFAGFIFVCNNETIPDLERKIFGLPYSHASSVCAIKQGMPLFLFNYSSRYLCGVFEAASDGGLNLDPFAWEVSESNMLVGTPTSRYPAQVRVCWRFPRPPVDEESFRPILDHFYGNKFRLELTHRQVQLLLKLFDVPEREFFSDKSKTWLCGSSIGADVPESPRSAFKFDYDCYSDCSSKGTSFGDDEDKAVQENTHQFLPDFNSQQFLCDRLCLMSLSETRSSHQAAEGSLQVGSPYDAPSMIGISSAPPSNSINCGGPRTDCKRNIDPYSAPQLKMSRDNYQIHSSFHEVDPAVNSNPSDPLQPSVLPPSMTVPYLRHENMIYIPVQAHLQAKGSEPRNLSERSLPSKLMLYAEKGNVVTSPNSLQQYCAHMVGPQCGQFLVPCVERPFPQYGQTLVTPMLDPFVFPANGQGHTLVNPQGSAVEELDSQGIPQLQLGKYHNFLQTVPFPVLLGPPVIPRVVPNLCPFVLGFAGALHFNILQFARLTRPSMERQSFVEVAIDRIRSSVRSAWPQADVQVFGSFATGLCLHHSDVDIAVINAPLLPSLVNMTMSQSSAFLLRELGLSLKTAKCVESYTVISNASVPVLKCYCWPIDKLVDASLKVPLIAVDITIGGIQNSSYVWSQAFKSVLMQKLGGQHTGGPAREYVLSKIQELPALAPLVLLLKSFLHHRGLSNVYLGGLGSYSLTLLLVHYLERIPSLRGGVPVNEMAGVVSNNSTISSDHTNDSDASDMNLMVENPNWSLGKYFVRRAAGVIDKSLALHDAGGVACLGTLLLGFLRTFGFERNLARKKIVLKGIDGSPGGIYKRGSRHIALWIDDPLRPGINVAAGSFGMCQVQAAFREMFLAFTNGKLPISPLQCNDQECQDLAVFGQLSYLSQLLTDRNDIVK